MKKYFQGLTIGTVAVLALVFWQSNSSFVEGTNLLKLDVLADVGALDIVDSPTFAGQGPFYIPGTIFAPGTDDVIGEFHCWGFFIQDGNLTVVSQEYDLFDRGKIQVQGIEDEGPRAVTGGTEEFRNIRGEMTGADLSAFPEFTVTFKLTGSKSK